MDITENVIQEARQAGLTISDSLYVSLTDHINSALDRFREGIALKNAIKTDLKRLYATEFQIGQKAIRRIQEETGVDLGDDEAAFIAMHIIASEMEDHTPSNVRNMAEMISAILQIARIHFKIEFHEDSFSYQRFITHLKFFATRVFNHTPYQDTMQDVYDILISQNAYVYSGVKKIAALIQKQYGCTLSKDESLYLLIHLKRILDEEQGVE